MIRLADLASSAPLVGRVAERQFLRGLLLDPKVRVVTVLGAPGVGKTRLAFEVAADIETEFTDGVAVVPLADVLDTSAVPSAVLRALGTDEVGSVSTAQLISGWIGDRNMLLVLDNFEQVIDAAGTVAGMAAHCPRLTVLTTSRRPLAVRAERCVELAPLPVPAPAATPDEIRAAEAVVMLTDRLRWIRPGVNVDEAAWPVLADICRSVEGLPLALELVAARARALPLSTIRDTVQRRLAVLTGGDRDLPARQRTMRDAIAWSYELLDAGSATVFRRMSVFVGGANLHGLAAVVADLGLDGTALMVLVEELVAHSLLTPMPGSATRFSTLEVIREFAFDRLAAADEQEITRRRHAAHFLTAAEIAAPHFIGPDQLEWLNRAHADGPNYVAAIGWATEVGDAETALRLCLALRFLWYVRGPLAEGRALFAAALAIPGGPPTLRARALVEASALARQHTDYAAAQELLGAALAMADTVGDDDLRAAALLQHGFVLHLQGSYAAARAALEECLALRQRADNRFGTALASHHLGLVAYHGDRDLALAWEMHCRCLALFRQLGNERHTATVLIAMSELARARDQLTTARELLNEALTYVTRLGDIPLLIHALHYAAAIAHDAGHLRRALRILGAAEDFEHASGAAPWPVVQAGTDRWLSRAVGQLGRTRADEARASGHGLTVDGAAALATTDQEPAAPDPLTEREREVAGLVAEGLTNRAIAARLVVSERTVEGHVARILGKLGFRGRSQIAAWSTRRVLDR